MEEEEEEEEEGKRKEEGKLSYSLSKDVFTFLQWR